MINGDDDQEPDYNNIGWLGGLIDHPFRFSNDINRNLIFIKSFYYRRER